MHLRGDPLFHLRSRRASVSPRDASPYRALVSVVAAAIHTGTPHAHSQCRTVPSHRQTLPGDHTEEAATDIHTDADYVDATANKRNADKSLLNTAATTATAIIIQRRIQSRRRSSTTSPAAGTAEVTLSS